MHKQHARSSALMSFAPPLKTQVTSIAIVNVAVRGVYSWVTVQRLHVLVCADTFGAAPSGKGACGEGTHHPGLKALACTKNACVGSVHDRLSAPTVYVMYCMCAPPLHRQRTNHFCESIELIPESTTDMPGRHKKTHSSIHPSAAAAAYTHVARKGTRTQSHLKAAERSAQRP